MFSKRDEPINRNNRLVGSFFLLFILFPILSSGQITKCDTIENLIGESKNLDAKRYILKSIAKNAGQSDCFFENAIKVFRTSDTAQNICKIWETVSLQPCKAKATCISLTLETSSVYQPSSSLCESAKKLFEECGNMYFSESMRMTAYYCDAFFCTEIDSLFFYKTKQNELEEAKKLSSIFAQRGCTTARTYLKANEIITEKEPTFNTVYHQAEVYAKMNKREESYKLYAKAEKLSSIPEQRSACYLGIARLLEKQKKYAKAKDFGQLASETDPQNQESFVFLAQLFLKAAQNCRFESETQKCALNLLIASMYAKAGNKSESVKFLKQSNLEQLQKENKIVVGQKQLLACFINEEIELKK